MLYGVRFGVPSHIYIYIYIYIERERDRERERERETPPGILYIQVLELKLF